MAASPSTGSRSVRASNTPRHSKKKGEDETAEQSRSNRLRWISAHLALIAMAVFSWAWCSQLFSTPESPGHYGFLKQSGLLPELTSFNTFSVPAGEACPPLRFYQRHSQLTEVQMESLNRQFLRDYIRNYSKAEKRLYLTGDYQIRKSRSLSENDPIQQGLLITLRAQVTPEGGTIPSDYPIKLHWILPGPDLAPEDFPIGTILSFQKIPDSITPLHISRHQGADFPLVSSTVISLAYGEREIATEKKINTRPPEKLRLRNSWPDTAE